MTGLLPRLLGTQPRIERPRGGADRGPAPLGFQAAVTRFAVGGTWNVCSGREQRCEKRTCRYFCHAVSIPFVERVLF